jgi:hypothetical protein
MTDEIAAWQAKLPERAGHGIASALRQTSSAPSARGDSGTCRRLALVFASSMTSPDEIVRRTLSTPAAGRVDPLEHGPFLRSQPSGRGEGGQRPVHG